MSSAIATNVTDTDPERRDEHVCLSVRPSISETAPPNFKEFVEYGLPFTSTCTSGHIGGSRIFRGSDFGNPSERSIEGIWAYGRMKFERL